MCLLTCPRNFFCHLSPPKSAAATRENAALATGKQAQKARSTRARTGSSLVAGVRARARSYCSPSPPAPLPQQTKARKTKPSTHHITSRYITSHHITCEKTIALAAGSRSIMRWTSSISASIFVDCSQLGHNHEHVKQEPHPEWIKRTKPTKNRLILFMFWKENQPRLG